MTTTEAQPHATIAQVRQNMVANCRWAVANHKHINYAEIRPWPIIPPRTLPFTTDCSGFAEMMARWSGAADPCGAGFDGSGYTDSILDNSPHITRAETQPGDFAVFGLHPSQHMVVLMESAAGGNGALCVSHGQQGDPVEVPLSEEIVAQPITFLQLKAGGAVPPQGGPNPFCPLDVNGEFAAQTIEALQWKLGVDQDGVFGPDTKRALQRHLGLTPTGNVGPDTIKALQRHVSVSQSGVWGKETTRGLQRRLNANTF
jgi:peptidoglycan hydrolase-like protein with peptidoglycan-binding domain